MHKCVCSNQCNRKGGCAVRESCHSCPALHRRAGLLAPRDNHSVAKGHLSFLVSVGGAGRALVASLVCAAWHDMVTYLLLAPCSFPSSSFRVMCVLSPLCSLRGCNILISPTSLRVLCVAAALCSLCKRASGGGGLVVPWRLAIAILGWCLTLVVVWYVTYLCLVRVLPSPISHRVVLATAYFSVRCLAWVYILLALDTAPHTSLATFVRCPSRVRGVTCNILAWLPSYPLLFMFGVFRLRHTPYASRRVGAGLSHACVHTCGMPPPWRGLYRTLASLPFFCVLCLVRRYVWQYALWRYAWRGI